MSHGIFPEAKDFEISHSQFIDHSRAQNTRIVNPQYITGPQTVHISSSTFNNARSRGGDKMSGFTRLLLASNIEALHDSSARYPPPRCHPGTRYRYIDKIANWSSSSHKHKRRIIWVHGPAGVGKSAVAQTCAEELTKMGKLGATFFFSRPNGRDRPDRLFTTISYELAVKDESCRKILNNMIQSDPSLLEKSIRQQFQDLIVTPLAELRAGGKDMKELVVIIDGLDECFSNEAQCDIVEIVAASVKDQTTPLLWVFVSRPEADIKSTFISPHIFRLSLHLELPVSRDIDHEIAKFLTDELESVRWKHALPSSWPSERNIGTLVNLSAGLFIYANTVIRFIRDENSPGPDDQLQTVLALAQRLASDEETHPLFELDLFYHLIMQRVPRKVLPTTLKILLLTTFENGTEITINAGVLGLSEAQFSNACRSLHSVLEVENWPPRIHFYHASFMDFLQDPKRSRDFCIKSDCVMSLRKELLERLDTILVEDNSAIFNMLRHVGHGRSGFEVFSQMVKVFFILCQTIPLGPEMLTALSEFDYEKMLVFWETNSLPCSEFPCLVDQFFQNIPKEFRKKIIQLYSQTLSYSSSPTLSEKQDIRVYVLGHGRKKVLLSENPAGYSHLRLCPEPSHQWPRSLVMGLRTRFKNWKSRIVYFGAASDIRHPSLIALKPAN
ncbi:hypothetical protein BDZ94DRAFT_1313583 [Collybia nuda]|uniref:Nephrocystin 3-like N-terminal domain-containing protein n=1 Tax=Collybia nuda TaxID=64659 RepID=A0A9P6CA76_9AGAR|nr:hypothetical protein BDZ94DRAFT_1313583 [Collybia nuda]